MYEQNKKVHRRGKGEKDRKLCIKDKGHKDDSRGQGEGEEIVITLLSNPNSPYISYFFFSSKTTRRTSYLPHRITETGITCKDRERERRELDRGGGGHRKKRTIVWKRKLKTKPHYKNNL